LIPSLKRSLTRSVPNGDTDTRFDSACPFTDHCLTNGRPVPRVARVRVDVKMVPELNSYETLRYFWLDAEETGFDGVWTSDHIQAVMDRSGPAFEGWTLLADLAAKTSRVRLGCSVTSVTFRNPGLLAKMAVTIDHISGGRLDFGIGAGWYKPDHRGFGIPFPRPRDRVEMLRETCEIARALWTGEPVTYEGRHYSLDDALCLPKPVQHHIPISIGGTGERFLLEVAARVADTWNCSTTTLDPSEFGRLSGVLDDHCTAVGRSPDAISRGVQIFLPLDDQAARAHQLASVDGYLSAGATHFIFVFFERPSTRQLNEARRAVE
jgi:F420-dependent oxidoreductase-like protein